MINPFSYMSMDPLVSMASGLSAATSHLGQVFSQINARYSFFTKEGLENLKSDASQFKDSISGPLLKTLDQAHKLLSIRLMAEGQGGGSVPLYRMGGGIVVGMRLRDISKEQIKKAETSNNKLINNKVFTTMANIGSKVAISALAKTLIAVTSPIEFLAQNLKIASNIKKAVILANERIKNGEDKSKIALRTARLVGLATITPLAALAKISTVMTIRYKYMTHPMETRTDAIYYKAIRSTVEPVISAISYKLTENEENMLESYEEKKAKNKGV